MKIRELENVACPKCGEVNWSPQGCRTCRLEANAKHLAATLQWICQEIRWGHDMTASLAVAEQALANAGVEVEA